MLYKVLCIVNTILTLVNIYRLCYDGLKSKRKTNMSEKAPSPRNATEQPKDRQFDPSAPPDIKDVSGEQIPINVAYARQAERDAAWDEHDKAQLSDNAEAAVAIEAEVEAAWDERAKNDAKPGGDLRDNHRTTNFEVPPTEQEPTSSPEAEQQQSQEQEDAIEDRPNAEELYKDAEILGKHYSVRRVVSELGNQRMRVIESIQAKWRNTLDGPKNLRLRLSQSLAQSRYNRHKKRVDGIRQLDSGLLTQRRMAKLDKAETRLNDIKKAYDDRRNTMKQRTTGVGERVAERRSESMASLRGRREAVLAKRSTRQELRAQGAGWIEARSIVRDIPKEHLDRVAKLAGIAAVSERRAAKAGKAEKKSNRQETRTTKDIFTNKERTQKYTDGAKRADKILGDIRAKLPEAEQHLESLRTELSNLDRNEDDPAWGALAEQVYEAERQVDIYTKRDIPYWEHVAKDNRSRVLALASEQAYLQGELNEHEQSATTETATAREQRATAEQHIADRNAAINTTLQ